MSSRLALLISGCAFLLPSFGTALDASPAGRTLVIDAGTVITVSGEEFSPGMIVIEDGEITLVGQNLEVPSSARRISARSETVMPGLILARTRLGLGAIQRTGVHADARVLDELHADELDGEPFLEAGIVAAAYVPSGIGFPGQAAVVRPPRDGEMTVLRESAYLPVEMSRNGRDRTVFAQGFERAKKEIEKAEKAKTEWDKKQAEAKKKAEAAEKKPESENKDAKKDPDSSGTGQSGTGQAGPGKTGTETAGKEKGPEEFTPPVIAPELVPLVAILRNEDGALPLLFQIRDAGNVLHIAEAIAEYEPLAAEKHRTVVFSPSSRSEQRPMVAALGKEKAVVITTPILTNLPLTINRINLPAELDRAGALLIFLPVGDSRDEFLRLRERTADLVRAGLSRKSALKALTLHPARFLGIDDRLGSIEKGRSADLLFLDGDPFAAATRATRTMIAGEWVWEEEGR